MPNLKDIRRRIKSVKNTQKITQAMRMVAAAKVKRAETRVKAIRPYSANLEALLAEVTAAARQQLDTLPANHPVQQWFSPKAQPSSPAIVVISSDRGLCGAFNTNVIRQALRLEAHLKTQGLTPKFYAVGRKAIQSLQRYGKSPILGTMAGMTAAPSSDNARSIVAELSRAYLAGDIDDIVVLSTHFKSLVTYKVLLSSLLPSRKAPIADIYPEHLQATMATEAVTAGPAREQLIEPDPATVLETLVPLYLTTKLYTLLLESSASELAARMMAMANATTNAREMIGSLTIQYNKLRQAAITQEILEIVSGAQALA